MRFDRGAAPSCSTSSPFGGVVAAGALLVGERHHVQIEFLGHIDTTPIQSIPVPVSLPC